MCRNLFIIDFYCRHQAFYNGLFTHEGYLYLTLPATPTQHILAKSLAAVLSLFTTLFVSSVGVCIITFYDLFVEIIKAVIYFVKLPCAIYGIHGVLYILGLISAFIISAFASYMFFYACIAFGQRSKNNRISKSVGAFFVYYAIVLVVLATSFAMLYFFKTPYYYIDDILYTSDLITQRNFNTIMLNIPEQFRYIFISKRSLRRRTIYANVLYCP